MIFSGENESWFWKVNKLHVTNVRFEQHKAYSIFSLWTSWFWRWKGAFSGYFFFVQVRWIDWSQRLEAKIGFLSVFFPIQGQRQLKVDQAFIRCFFFFFLKNTHMGNLEFTVWLWEEIEGPWGMLSTHKQEIWSWESCPGQIVRMTKQTTETASPKHLVLLCH